ncbi:unnamed protein product, partial [Mesorhabditis spiculigera]
MGEIWSMIDLRTLRSPGLEVETLRTCILTDNFPTDLFQVTSQAPNRQQFFTTTLTRMRATVKRCFSKFPCGRN